MPAIILTCPLDGLVLGAYEQKPLARTDIATGARLGGHIHMMVAGEFECANGHRWKASGDYIIERVK